MALAALIVASALANSCSRAVRMSLVEPAGLTAAPAQAHSKEPPLYTRTDSVATQDAGVIVVSGDTLRVYQRVGNNAGITHLGDPVSYQFKRGAKELRVVGYQPAHGEWRDVEGYVRARDGVLEFRREATHPNDLRRSTPAETVRVDPRQVSRIDLDQTDPVYTTVVIVSVAAVIAGIALIAMAVVHNGWGY